jgi:Tfp pilus assembly protein PilF
MDPSDPSVLNNYAIFLSECRNNNTAAEAIFVRSVELAPNSSTALCNYASFLENAGGKYDEAEKL